MKIKQCKDRWSQCDDVVEHASMFFDCDDIEEHPTLREKCENLVRADAEFREELERATEEVP